MKEEAVKQWLHFFWQSQPGWKDSFQKAIHSIRQHLKSLETLHILSSFKSVIDGERAAQCRSYEESPRGGFFFFFFCTQEVKLFRFHVPLSSCHAAGVNKAHLQLCIQNFPRDTHNWMHMDAHSTGVGWLLTPQRQKWIEWNKVWISHWHHAASSSGS